MRPEPRGARGERSSSRWRGSRGSPRAATSERSEAERRRGQPSRGRHRAGACRPSLGDGWCSTRTTTGPVAPSARRSRGGPGRRAETRRGCPGPSARSGRTADRGLCGSDTAARPGASRELDRAAVARWARGGSSCSSTTRREARRVDDVRRDFVANVSHELKTPVAALSLLGRVGRWRPLTTPSPSSASRAGCSSRRRARHPGHRADRPVPRPGRLPTGARRGHSRRRDGPRRGGPHPVVLRRPPRSIS